MQSHLLLAIITLSVVALPAHQTLGAQETHLSRSQLKVLLKTAHTGPEYSELANYYHTQAESFHKKELAVSKEMEEELRLRANVPSKGPSHYDQCRNLEDYYKSKREEYTAKEKFYADKLQPTETPETR